jgi:hypothetical protein
MGHAGAASNRAGLSDDEGAKNTIAGLNRLKKIGEDHGVNICIELPTSSCPRATRSPRFGRLSSSATCSLIVPSLTRPPSGPSAGNAVS